MADYRVLHIAQKLPGGVGAYLAEVSAYQLQHLGAQRLRLLIAEGERSSLPPLPDECLRHFPTSDRDPASLLRFAWSALKAVWDERPDVVHLHSTYAGFLRFFLAALPKSRRPKLVYCAHGWAFNMRWSERKRALFAAVERWLAPRTDRILCISRFEYRCGVEQGLDEGRLQVLHNGVSGEIGPGVETPLPRASDRIDLLFIGRIDEQKGYDIAEAAMARLVGRPFHLHVVGAAVVDKERSQADDLPNITHHGWQQRERIWQFIESADAVLVPSRWEGFGLAAIEGMRQGKPVIASRVDALPEVVRDGVTGKLFPAEDAEALAECIASLDRDELAMMGRAARQDFLERFTGEAMNQAILRVYEDVLAI